MSKLIANVFGIYTCLVFSGSVIGGVAGYAAYNPDNSSSTSRANYIFTGVMIGLANTTLLPFSLYRSIYNDPLLYGWER